MKSIWRIVIPAIIALAFVKISNAQWITHHNPVPQPDIAKPAVGVPITDPQFGTTVMRISNARESEFAGIVPQYSKRQAWNADDSFLLLHTGDGRTLLYDGQTYAPVKELDGYFGVDVFWHPTDPNVFYFNPDSILYSYNLSHSIATRLHVFTPYTWANTRGEGNMSNDGRYYAVVGQVYDYITYEVTFKDIVVCDLQTNTEISVLSIPQDSISSFDWVSISPLGNYVVVDYANEITGRYNGVELYDRNLNFIWQKPLGAGHSDLGVDANGDEVLVMDIYDPVENVYHIKKFQLSDGQETTLLSVSQLFDLHISLQNQQRSEWCFISTFDSPGRLTDVGISWLPFEDEIFAVKLDGSGEVQRIAHHHSRRYSPSTPDPDNSVYWAEPHATVSRDGSRILFGSNWREDVESDSSVDTYLVNFSSWVSVQRQGESHRQGLNLNQNYPNPFNISTVIGYHLPVGARVTLKVYDIIGRELVRLVDEYREAGRYEVEFDAAELPSGVYIYRLQAGKFMDSKKLLYVK